MKNAMRKDLKERYSNIKPVLRFVTSLDPRFKQLPFLGGTEKSAVFSQMVKEVCKVQNLIKVKVEFQDTCEAADDDVIADDPPPFPSVPGLQNSESASPVKKKIKLEDSPPTSSSVSDESVLGSILGDVYITTVEPPKPPILIAEQQVNEYRYAGPIPLHENPLQWWKANEFR
jgi:hypothetical protein